MGRASQLRMTGLTFEERKARAVAAGAIPWTLKFAHMRAMIADEWLRMFGRGRMVPRRVKQHIDMEQFMDTIIEAVEE